MPSSPDRANAKSNQLMGGAKEAIGSVVDKLPFSETKIEQEGKEQRAKGDAEYKAAQGEDKAKSFGNDVKGNLKENVGGLFSDDMKKEGQQDQAKADAQDFASKH